MRQILIVDDEESIRVSLAALIRRHGYQVETLSDGKTALQRMRAGDVDMAFVDVRMPEMDGIVLTRKATEEHLPVSIIVMSAYGNAEDAREALQAGAYDYVTKPFKSDEINLVLTKAGQRKVATPSSAFSTDKEASQDDIVFRSDQMKHVLELVKKVGRVDSTALIIGESGTGKELVARALHRHSHRHAHPMVAVNCGAFPENLIESELFGYKKGAFTDAVADRSGLFAQATGGTLLLDEVGELPLSLQVRLLRVLQEGVYRPLGSQEEHVADVRVVAATYRDLETKVRQGDFRQDLYYRLNVLPIHIPPLRERPDDIPLLIRHFIDRNNRRFATDISGVSRTAERQLISYHWPGNVRELQNVIERAQVLCDGRVITESDLPALRPTSRRTIETYLSSDDLSIKKAMRFVEATLIRKALDKTGGNRTSAARLLEISHRALLYKMKDYGIS